MRIRHGLKSPVAPGATQVDWLVGMMSEKPAC